MSNSYRSDISDAEEESASASSSSRTVSRDEACMQVHVRPRVL
jgi:hypothetical protein